jgi:hypothetical protein
MMDTLTQILSGAALGCSLLGLFYGLRARSAAKQIEEAWSKSVGHSLSLETRLQALRRNAYLTYERGVRVRYASASSAVRERAEQA